MHLTLLKLLFLLCLILASKNTDTCLLNFLADQLVFFFESAKTNLFSSPVNLYFYLQDNLIKCHV